MFNAYCVLSTGNYTVREVLMKNNTRVWRNVYKIFRQTQVRFFINTSRTSVYYIFMLNLTVFVNKVLSTICFANFRNKYFQVFHFLFKETFSNTSIHPSKVFKHFVNIFVKRIFQNKNTKMLTNFITKTFYYMTYRSFSCFE